MLNKDLANLCL